MLLGMKASAERKEYVCNMCGVGAVGDKFHVLFECTDAEMDRLRDMYIPNYYTNRPTQFKYISFMLSTSLVLMRKIFLFLRMMLCMFR